MNAKMLVRLTQEEIEAMVKEFIQMSYPEFKLKDAVLETSMENDRISSWWVACEHEDGNESIMEDEEIMKLIQQKLGIETILECKASETEKAFILELRGK